jgi:hypothetical protein
MSARFTHILGAVFSLVLATAGLPSHPNGQGPWSTRQRRLASRPVPGRVPPGLGRNEYQLTSVHDRIAHSTRVSVQSFQRSEHIADGSFVRFTVAVTYPGHAFAATHDSVELEFVGSSPLRRGWAIGRPAQLLAVLGDSVPLAFPSVEYRRTPTHLGDSRRIDVLLFRIASIDLMALASSDQVSLRVGRFTIKLDERGLEPLRALRHELGWSQQ